MTVGAGCGSTRCASSTTRHARSRSWRRARRARSTTCATPAATHFDGRPGAARCGWACATRSTTASCAASTTTPAPRSSSTWPGVDGQQQALGGGGRYDGLVEVLGGPPTPGIGFGIGIDRTVLAAQERRAGGRRRRAAGRGGRGRSDGPRAAAARWPGAARRPASGSAPTAATRKLGRQLESAAKLGARWAVIVGRGAGAGEGHPARPRRRRAARGAAGRGAPGRQRGLSRSGAMRHWRHRCRTGPASDCATIRAHGTGLPEPHLRRAARPSTSGSA